MVRWVVRFGRNRGHFGTPIDWGGVGVYYFGRYYLYVVLVFGYVLAGDDRPGQVVEGHRVCRLEVRRDPGV